MTNDKIHYAMKVALRVYDKIYHSLPNEIRINRYIIKQKFASIQLNGRRDLSDRNNVFWILLLNAETFLKEKDEMDPRILVFNLIDVCCFDLYSEYYSEYILELVEEYENNGDYN